MGEEITKWDKWSEFYNDRWIVWVKEHAFGTRNAYEVSGPSLKLYFQYGPISDPKKRIRTRWTKNERRY